MVELVELEEVFPEPVRVMEFPAITGGELVGEMVDVMDVVEVLPELTVRVLGDLVGEMVKVVVGELLGVAETPKTVKLKNAAMNIFVFWFLSFFGFRILGRKTTNKKKKK